MLYVIHKYKKRFESANMDLTHLKILILLAVGGYGCSTIHKTVPFIETCEFRTALSITYSLGAKQRYVGYFARSLHPPPPEVNFGCYYGSGACLGGLKTHVVLGYQWQVFCKQPVQYVPLLN